MSDLLIKHYKREKYDLGELGIETTTGCGGSFDTAYVCTRHTTHGDKLVHIATGIDNIVLIAGYEVTKRETCD